MSARSLLCTVVASLALLATAPPALAGVIVVALDGSGDTFSVEDAINSAAPGDLILVRPGNYSPISPIDPAGFHEIDKSLTIVGEGAGATIGFMRVTDLPAGQTVVLRNLAFYGPLFPGNFVEKLIVRNCAGTVIFEDCKLTGLVGNFSQLDGFPGAVVRRSDAVTFTRCTITGGPGQSALESIPFTAVAGSGGPAMIVTESKISLQHSTVTGGKAGTDEVEPIDSRHGGDAMHVDDDSTILIAGGAITGGAGNDGGPAEFPLDARGGDGIVQIDSGLLLRLIGVTPQGGQGGTLGDDSSAPDGEGLVLTDATVESYPPQARGTSMPGILHVGDAATLGISGAEGELAKIMVGLDLVHAQLGGKKGVFSIGGPAIGPLILGTIPASGVLEFPVSFPPSVLLGLEGLRVDFQGLTFGADGLMFGNPTSTLVLAPGL